MFTDVIICQLTVPYCTGGMSSSSSTPTINSIQVNKQAAQKFTQLKNWICLFFFTFPLLQIFLVALHWLLIRHKLTQLRVLAATNPCWADTWQLQTIWSHSLSNQIEQEKVGNVKSLAMNESAVLNLLFTPNDQLCLHLELTELCSWLWSHVHRWLVLCPCLPG